MPGRRWCLVWFSPLGYKSRVVGLGVTDCLVHRCVEFVACQTHPVLSEASSSYLFSYARKGKIKIMSWPGCEDEESLCSLTSPMDLLKDVTFIWVSEVFHYCNGHLMSYLVSTLIKLCSCIGVIDCSLVMVPLGGRWWNIRYVLPFLSFSVSSNTLWGASALLDG